MKNQKMCMLLIIEEKFEEHWPDIKKKGAELDGLPAVKLLRAPWFSLEVA